MAKLTPRKFTVEDFKDQQSWIGKLLQPVNDFIQQVYQGLTNGLTIEDNLYQEVKEIKVIVDSTTYPFKFKTKFAAMPKGMHVIYCVDSNGGSPTSAPWVTQTYSNGQITVTNIAGLTSGLTYVVRLHIVYQ